MNILVSEDIRTVCPEFVGAALEAHITNTPYSAPLWEEIKAFQTDYCRKYTTESIKEMPPIQATRAVYKRCGKTQAVTALRRKPWYAACCGDWTYTK